MKVGGLERKRSSVIHEEAAMSIRFATAAVVAALVAGYAMSATPAKAGSVDLHFGIGVPAPVYHNDYDRRYDGRRHDRPYYGRSHRDRSYYGRPYGEPRHVRARVSCREGVWSAREEGFRRVRPIDCTGRHYSYRGYRDGTAWHIRVSAYSGDVINARPLDY
jgi:hypothetical protein